MTTPITGYNGGEKTVPLVKTNDFSFRPATDSTHFPIFSWDETTRGKLVQIRPTETLLTIEDYTGADRSDSKSTIYRLSFRSYVDCEFGAKAQAAGTLVFNILDGNGTKIGNSFNCNFVATGINNPEETVKFARDVVAHSANPATLQLDKVCAHLSVTFLENAPPLR